MNGTHPSREFKSVDQRSPNSVKIATPQRPKINDGIAAAKSSKVVKTFRTPFAA